MGSSSGCDQRSDWFVSLDIVLSEVSDESDMMPKFDHVVR